MMLDTSFIVALALEHSERLVTRDAERFSRIPGLALLEKTGHLGHVRRNRAIV